MITTDLDAYRIRSIRLFGHVGDRQFNELLRAAAIGLTESHRRAADQPKVVITTVYGEDKSGRDVNARSFRALQLLESVAAVRRLFAQE